MSTSFRLLPLLLASLLSACTDEPAVQAEPGEALSAGSATVMRADANAYSMPSANLSPTRRLDFSVGNSFFRNPWVVAPSSTIARDGLGPLLNTNACQNCHIKDGRGHPPGAFTDNAVSALLRLSIPAGTAHAEHLKRHGLLAEPTYGGQLQDMSIPGTAPEGRLRVDYRTQRVRFADGHEVELRQPQIRLDQLANGPLHPDTLFSLRVAPPMIGLGLLEAVPEQDLLSREDPDDSNRDGISGRANRVFDHARQAPAIGRFGWKAGQPNLNQQNADAFFNDMGLSTSLLAGSSCTAAQSDCLTLTDGGTPEVSDHILGLVLFYTRNLGVPARRKVDDPQVLAGKGLFVEAGCSSCHVPKLVTAANAAEPELANQTIRPYTDLLLHDMGDGLADGRPEFAASGREWRTPPLWGIGLTPTVNGHSFYLHDGRARSLLEAVLWHGGEAEATRQQVLRFDRQQRDALVAFLESL